MTDKQYKFRPHRMLWFISVSSFAAALWMSSIAFARQPPAASATRIFEATFESAKTYSDPFNDVELDVIFSKEGQMWRVPAFWRGGQKWSVRFAPPSPGLYRYRLQSTDAANPDLNGHEGEVQISVYEGPNPLLERGALRVSANKRYFEQADGTPFYWLADTWWTGLSDRLKWDDFKKLVADRQAKGFTVVQMAVGLVPWEERAPSDPGFCNEGGCVWEPGFTRINPKYFDYADRRIEYLLDQGIAPALVGAWNLIIKDMGAAKMKQHWRYIIARYGAYPAFWILGGEVLDPPADDAKKFPVWAKDYGASDWTEVAKYVRATDPHHHPLTVHEANPPYDRPLQDETLTDFDMFQSGHTGWSAVILSISQLNLHYARTALTKPLVQGEIGYEKLGETHLDDFQRAAFWLSMLNGGAGHTYGANGVFESYTSDKPLHRIRHSFMTWQEGMNLPGSYQIGLGSKLLRQYPWWQFEPRPEWVAPRGTTLLEPNSAISNLAAASIVDWTKDDATADLERTLPSELWKSRRGTFRLPYAAGIPRKVRVIYMPYFRIAPGVAPTVLGLEADVRYQAYFWEPSKGIKVDLGLVARPTSGARLFHDGFSASQSSSWISQGDMAQRKDGTLVASGETLMTLKKIRQKNAVASVQVNSDAYASLLLRYQNPDNYVAAVYSPEDQSLYLIERQKGQDGRRLGAVAVPEIGRSIRLTVEVREDKAALSVTDGQKTFSTPIVDINNGVTGSAGLLHQASARSQTFDNFELRASPDLIQDASLDRTLRDAKGELRGVMEGPGQPATIAGFPGTLGWSDFARRKSILLDAYRPDRLPTAGDWLLVLATEEAVLPESGKQQ